MVDRPLIMRPQVTGLADAMMDSVPLVAITGQVPIAYIRPPPTPPLCTTR